MIALIVGFLLTRSLQSLNRSDHDQTIFGSFVDFVRLSMDLRSRAIPEPWPLPPVHSSLELEASLLDLGVQELIEPEDVSTYGLTSDALLQWAALTEFPCVVGVFELNCWAVPLTAVGRGGGPSGTAQTSDSHGVKFIKISADLESQLEIVSEVPVEFTQFSPDERLLHTPLRTRSAASTRAVSSMGGVPAPQPLGAAGVLAKSITVLGKIRNARSLEEEFGDPGVTTSKPEYTEVFNGGGSEGEGLQQLGDHAQVERTLCIRHEYPGVIIAALEARVREDLTTHPEESGSWERHAEEYPLRHCGHL